MAQIPTFEIPPQLRELAERNVDQARTAYSQFMDAMTQAMGMWQKAVPGNQMTSGFQTVQDRATKFAKDNALLSQLFVMDNKTPIAQVVANAAKEVGSAVVLKDYVRFQLGEGIEKEVSDFAAEVAAAAGLN